MTATSEGTESSALPCAPVGGRALLVKMKMAFSGDSLMRFRMTYTNCPTVKSDGTRYLRVKPWVKGTRRRLAIRGPRVDGAWRTSSCRCQARRCAQHAQR